jgi:4-diphosphocytidyl-2-C-methyl-D-erythritol kinase
MATRVRSYSKINLGLAIGPVRADGFHGLVTLYQTLALHDVVTVEVRRPASQSRDAGQPAIALTTNHPQVPTDARNTAWKMVERALERLELVAEVAIHIEKALPVQGGMGAGSANAAAALLGLERELGVEVPGRMEIAAQVGSDVPLFLVGGAVLGVGRGEQVSAMPDLPATWCVVAVPEVGVSTPRAFQEWDGLSAAKAELLPAAGSAVQAGSPLRLTSPARPDRLEKLSHAYASVFGEQPLEAAQDIEQAPDTSGIVRGLNPERDRDGLEAKSFQQGDTRNDLAGNPLLALVRTGIENDFEQVVFPQYPFLREIKHELMGTSAGLGQVAVGLDAPARPASGDAVYAALSGSGSALFGLYRSEADARAAQQRVQAAGCKAILTETLPRQQYWRRMFAE